MPGVMLPQSFVLVVAAFADCFTAPGYANFCRIVAGWAHCLGRRTITGVALASGAVGSRHISVFHRFFSRATWVLDELGHVLFDLALAWLPADQPVLVAGTTPWPASAASVWRRPRCITTPCSPRRASRSSASATSGWCWPSGRLCRRGESGASPCRSRSGCTWASNAVGNWMPLPAEGSAEHASPSGDTGGRTGAPERAGTDAGAGGSGGGRGGGAHRLRRRRPPLRRPPAAGGASRQRPHHQPLASQRRLVDAAASPPTGPTWAYPPTGRAPTPAACHGPGPPALASPRRHDLRPPGPHDGAPPHRPLVHGAPRSARPHRRGARPGGQAQGRRLLHRPVASARFILETYAKRWCLGVTLHDAKQHLGLEDSAAQAAPAVERTAPMAALVYALILLWYAGRSRERPGASRPLRPWYRQKSTPSFRDMLAAVRRESRRLYITAPSSPPRCRNNSSIPWPDALLATA